MEYPLTEIPARRMTMRIQTIVAAAISLAFAGVAPLTAQTQWLVTKTFHIGGEGGWDYLTVDSPNHRFFVTRATHTQAIDEETGKVLADIPGRGRTAWRWYRSWDADSSRMAAAAARSWCST